MSMETSCESGRPGAVLLVRLRPNQDLTEGVERACAQAGWRHAVVRSAVGSLNDPVLEIGAPEETRRMEVAGTGVEILTLQGEVRPGSSGAPRATLQGTVADTKAKVHGGRFRRGECGICITLELVLQQWLPDSEGSAQ